MTLLKGQVLHLGVLGVAAVLALGVWTRDDDAQVSSQPTQVEVWPGDPESVHGAELRIDHPQGTHRAPKGCPRSLVRGYGRQG